MQKSLNDKVEKMAKERVRLFTKKVLSKLKDQIDARNKALEGMQKANRISQIDEEIKTLNVKMDSLRKSAAEAENHDSTIREIIEIRKRVETLKEVREEIENKVLPDAERRFVGANTALANAAESIIRKMAPEEKAAINERYENLVAEILSYNDGMVEFGSAVLGLPLRYNLGCGGELLIGSPDINVHMGAF